MSKRPPFPKLYESTYPHMDYLVISMVTHPWTGKPYWSLSLNIHPSGIPLGYRFEFTAGNAQECDKAYIDAYYAAMEVNETLKEFKKG